MKYQIYKSKIKDFLLILFTTIIIFLIPIRKSFAQELVRPIPDDYNNPITQSSLPAQATSDVAQAGNNPINQSTYNPQLTTYNLQLNTYKPSITFGDLLQYSPEEIDKKIKEKGSEQQNISKARKVQELLEKLYTDSQKELAEFQNQESRVKNQAKSNSQLTTHNLQLTTNNPPPTPYIPIPTLLAKVHSLATTPSPTYHPRIESILADEKSKQFSTSTSLSVNNRAIGELNENPKKTVYRIALLGDSMVDTLGKDLPHLQTLLTSAYPDYFFLLLNYGQGGTDLESGLSRLTNTTSYLDTEYPPLLSYKIDILVVESFAYNHWSGQFYDLDRQWLTIAKIIDTVKMHSPKTQIILAATIAPNAKTFGDGKLNWPEQLKWNSAIITKAYLQNMINFATSEGYPLADAYHPSLGSDGNGLARYINQSDHLHPSDEGARLFSEKVFEAIQKNRLIK